MNRICIPTSYTPKLDGYELQRAIDFIKITFQMELAQALSLQRVSAPLFVSEASGLNDNLSGTERPVAFDVPAIQAEAQVVHSLAKWKREALGRYRFRMSEGLFTDMNAIRRDEALDNIHSIYVDQWDWEKIISPQQRNADYLHSVVRRIVDAICNVNHLLKARFPSLNTTLKREVVFTTAQALETAYPHLTPEEREAAFAERHGTVFIRGIGDRMASGQRHGHRAPDYDDWQLNGDIIFWNEVLGCAFELSSMGIRVDAQALMRQLRDLGMEDRMRYDYHRHLVEGAYPQTIGGGIGQSRLCMLLIGTAHIGEVQASLWDEQTQRACAAHGIRLL